jgi:hypothetical protein
VKEARERLPSKLAAPWEGIRRRKTQGTRPEENQDTGPNLNPNPNPNPNPNSNSGMEQTLCRNLDERKREQVDYKGQI